jgi:hypothetical protein
MLKRRGGGLGVALPTLNLMVEPSTGKWKSRFGQKNSRFAAKNSRFLGKLGIAAAFEFWFM